MGNIITRLNGYRLRMKNLTDVFEGRVPKVVIIGLDGAGKTALLYKSKLDNTIYANVPPRGINIEHMRPKRGARIQLFDMPGSKITRHLWYNWFFKTEAVVFVVDSADKVRIDEAKFELQELLKSRDLVKVPLIVVANKQDAEGALNSEEVSTELELSSIEDRDWSIHAASAMTSVGVKTVFTDVVDKIKAFRHYKSGLGSPLRESASTKKNSPSIEDDSEPKFTNIENTDITEAEKIPSLFDSINRLEKVTDLDANSDVVPSTSSSNDQPTYARPTEQEVNSSHSEERLSVSDRDNPSPDSVSDSSQIVEKAQIEIVNGHDKHNSDTEIDNSESKTDETIDNDNSIKSSSSEQDKKDCVQEIDDVVSEEEMNSITKLAS